MRYITTLSDISIRKNQIRRVCKIIPLLNPNKQFNKAKFCRPILLLSPRAKSQEKLLLITGEATVEVINLVLETVRVVLITSSAVLLNMKRQNHRTAMVELDLTSAFNTVITASNWRTLHVQSTLPRGIIKINEQQTMYMREKFGKVEYCHQLYSASTCQYKRHST